MVNKNEQTGFAAILIIVLWILWFSLFSKLTDLNVDIFWRIVIALPFTIAAIQISSIIWVYYKPKK